MLSIDEAINIIQNKEQNRDSTLDRNDRLYYEMSLHIDGACPAFFDANDRLVTPTNYFGKPYQDIFENFLFTKYPYQTEATRQYQLSQYRPYQKESFVKAIQVIIGAIFQDDNYSIEVNDEADNEYIWGNNFDGKDISGYVQERFTDSCVDANGYFLVIPKKSRIETGDKVEPDIWFIRSVDIIHVTKEEIIFAKDDVFWLVNTIGYFRFKIDGGVVSEIDEDGYFAHMLGYVPIIISGGTRNTQGYYESWLYAAKPIADEFVGEKSLSAFVNKQNAHPFYIAADEECPNCSNGEYQFCTYCNVKTNECGCNDPANWRLASCKSCGGSGKRAHDPAKWMIVPKEDMANDQLKIVSADTNIVKVQFDNVKDVEKRIMRSLHLNYVEEAQSGEAKARDMETRYQFISMISNFLFDTLIHQLIINITSLRNISVSNGTPVPKQSEFTIVKPTQFSIMTDEDIISSINVNSPDFIKTKQIEDYVDKKFGGYDALKRKTSLIFQLDKIAVSSMETIQSLLINGGIDRRDLRYHIQLPLIIDKIERDKGSDYIVSTDFDVLKSEIDVLFNAENPEPNDIIRNAVRGVGMGLEGNEDV